MPIDKIFIISIMKNIEHNFNKNILSVHSHNLEVFRLLILKDGHLSSCSDDGTLII